MELSYEEAKRMLDESIQKIPKLHAVASSPEFSQKLRKIIRDESISETLVQEIEWEILCVLARYSPIDELPENIAESTGISLEVSENLVNMIEAILLHDISNDLYAFALQWHTTLTDAALVPDAKSELKEKLELRPEGVVRKTPEPAPENTSQPLTRESILRTLAPQRTMAADIADLKDPKQEPHQGYEAYVAAKEAKQ